MHYVTHRSHWMQKHKFGVMYPGALFVESIPVRHEHEKKSDPVWRLYRPLGGLPCDVRQWKVLDIAIDEVSGALSMHAAAPGHTDCCGTRRSDSLIRAS
jgi:hypothetical protein